MNFTIKMQDERFVADELTSVWSLANENINTVKIVQALYHCLHIRDPLTAAHSVHMAHHSYRLAEYFDKENAPLYFAGSLTHDIGKVGMSDHILKGKHVLTLDERNVLRSHVSDGYRILSGLGMPKIMLDIVRYHHERFNGSGYLEGLQGEKIPLAGRITAITDTYSALTSDRPYSKAIGHNRAVEIMLEDVEQFDPIILAFFIENFK